MYKEIFKIYLIKVINTEYAGACDHVAPSIYNALCNAVYIEEVIDVMDIIMRHIYYGIISQKCISRTYATPRL